MRSSYTGLLVGLVFAILRAYLLIGVNFQSWLDPKTKGKLTKLKRPRRKYLEILPIIGLVRCPDITPSITLRPISVQFFGVSSAARKR